MSRFDKISIRRAWLATGFVLVLAACGDGNDAEPFDPQGTSSDMNAVSTTFSSPSMASLSWAANSIDGVFGAPMVSSSFGAIKTAASASPEPGRVGSPTGTLGDGVQSPRSSQRGARRDPC